MTGFVVQGHILYINGKVGLAVTLFTPVNISQAGFIFESQFQTLKSWM